MLIEMYSKALITMLYLQNQVITSWLPDLCSMHEIFLTLRKVGKDAGEVSNKCWNVRFVLLITAGSVCVCGH